ncbi:MAG: AAA family ATPase [Phaeodactylibacter sp.]|uniref:AAA family ATPase n=1 Tax=Phaeodactylibacter sp. TaxID=1940289 RepID=UPI0032EB0096
MANVKLQVPTLVSDLELNGKRHYSLRPLFLDYPLTTHRRYEHAVVQYQKEIKNLFKGFSLNRDNTMQLLWMMFRPEVRYHKFQYEFTVDRQFIAGQYPVAVFTLQGMNFVSLPTLNNYMFISDADSHTEFEQACRRAIRKLLKQIKREEQEAFVPQDYFCGERDFLTEIEVTVNIAPTAFSFDAPPNDWFLSSLLDDTSFDGAVEAEKTGQDLNALYPAELNRAYHQEERVQQLYQLLYQPAQTPVALVGPEGVGKHTIIQEVVWRYESGQYEKNKATHQRLWHIDPTRLIAGMSIVGMWQKRLESIIEFIRQPSGQKGNSDKMLVDNPIALLRIGKSAQNDMTLSDVLRPYLEKRQLQLILIATPEEWKTLQEKGRRFSNLFRVVRMEEPDMERAVRIIIEKRRQLERNNDNQIKIQAIEQLLAIQRNYLRNKPLPGSVIKLLEQLAVKHRYGVVDAPEVREEFRNFSGLQEHIFDAAHPIEPQAIQETLGQELVGQPEAVRALADVVHLVKAKLNHPGRPLSSFLFIGPTGVGKTQAAKVLCDYLMGSQKQLLRFDMNEYIDSGSLQRLIGDYYNPEGQLTGAVRYRPFSIVLLDEIEKAHPLVLDLLLQLLDDGRLTDSLGRAIDFTNTIIIMTSNVGAREAGTQLGYTHSDDTQSHAYRRAMEQQFRPEFINRIDHTIVFNPLKPEHILGIARIQIKELLKRDGFVRRATILNISQEALEWVAHRGFDPRMGGRALKRQIERDLTALSAEQLINTHSDHPILMDIILTDGQLHPQITLLEFVEPLEERWMPELPEETKGKGFYRRLIRTLDRMLEELEAYEAANEEDGPIVYIDGQSAGQLDWEYHHFKSKVVETKETINNISLAFRDRYYKIGPAIPLRMKSVNMVPRSDWSTKGIRENFKDKLFQQEGIKEISDAYQYANVQFDSLRTEFLNHFLTVAVLQLQQRAVLLKPPGKLRLQVASCIIGLGQPEVAFLLDRYMELLQLLDLSPARNDEAQYIDVEGYGLRALLEGESGIHLFYTTNRTPIPVSVSIDGHQDPEYGHRVVRLYDAGHTITDLRTGFANAVNITAEEFLLLVYAGVPAQLRKALYPL